MDDCRNPRTTYSLTTEDEHQHRLWLIGPDYNELVSMLIQGRKNYALSECVRQVLRQPDSWPAELQAIPEETLVGFVAEVVRRAIEAIGYPYPEDAP